VKRDESTVPGGAHWFSEVGPPEVLADPEAVAWDDAADFVIIGYGGAGVSAAVQGAEKGLDVLAVDRFDGGGSTAMNGGVYYAGGTSVQKEAGIEDSVEEMYKYLKTEVGTVVSDETLRRYCETSPESIEWLKKHGVGFNSRTYMKKINYPDPSYYLYHPDNSLNEARQKIARSAPRGHRVLAPPRDMPIGYGVYMTRPLSESAATLGVRFRAQCEARQLITDSCGRVIGFVGLEIPRGTPAWETRRKLQARANRLMTFLPPTFPGAHLTYDWAGKVLAKVAKIEAQHRVKVRIRARRGLCLSAGGFVFNRAMLHHFAPQYDLGLPLGQPGDDGSGIRLGQSVGGAVEAMGRCSAWRGINPPDAWPHGMLVNGKGQRYIDESLYMANIGAEMCERQGGVGYIIFDAAGNRATWRQLLFGKLLGFQRNPALLTMLLRRKKARTVDDLAFKLGIDPGSLQATIDSYNAAARGEAIDPFGKSRKDMVPVARPPFYAIDASISNNLLPMPIMTVGGLRVAEDSGQVIREDGSRIEGLYAAGRTAIGICSNIYVSGLSMSDCVFSGRRAASHVAAAADITRQPVEATAQR
jgi:3-oxo-5alpha-steroid 4-dehydrogenase